MIKDAVQSVNDVIAAKGFDWQVARDGMPINQEDLAFTLLTFGHVIPQAMRALGIKLSNDEDQAFLHCWNVSGFLLGVDETLMAHTLADAEELFARIKGRQAGRAPPARASPTACSPSWKPTFSGGGWSSLWPRSSPGCSWAIRPRRCSG